MLALAIKDEVNLFLAKHSSNTDESGRKDVTKNEHVPSRQILTGMGPFEIKQPRVDGRT